MYKAIQNKKYYLAFNRFPKTAKKGSNVYRTGFWKWNSDVMKVWSIVIGTYRVLFGKKKIALSCSPG